LFPKYDREKSTIVEEHMNSFQYFTHNLFVENNDVLMRLFFQTLEGDIKKWFRGLPHAIIDTW